MEVGKASQEAIVAASRLVKPGARLLDVAEAAEKQLKASGFGLAFPINLSQNERAAHYSPSLEDKSVFSEKDIVKIDFGAEKDGMLGDGALTIDLSGEHGKMIEAAELALDNAISVVKAGVEVRKIGAEISKTVEKAGFKVILNLGGHGIEENDLHTGSFIPNYDNGDEHDARGGQHDSDRALHNHPTQERARSQRATARRYTPTRRLRLPRSEGARKLLKEIEAKYPKNPFAARWLGSRGCRASRSTLRSPSSTRNGCIAPSPVLVEVGKAPVAQAEAELLVEHDGCRIITRAKL